MLSGGRSMTASVSSGWEREIGSSTNYSFFFTSFLFFPLLLLSPLDVVVLKRSYAFLYLFLALTFLKSNKHTVYTTKATCYLVLMQI